MLASPIFALVLAVGFGMTMTRRDILSGLAAAAAASIMPPNPALKGRATSLLRDAHSLRHGAQSPLAAQSVAAPPDLRINADRLRVNLEGLSVHGRPAGGTFADGVSRVAFSDADIAGLNIPTGIPLVYRLTEDLQPTQPGGEYLDPDAAAAAIQACLRRTPSITKRTRIGIAATGADSPRLPPTGM
jgi:hypothetical protein